MSKSSQFSRSGLASLGDLSGSEFDELFAKLERIQDEFLGKESQFRSPEYLWPRDPLHCWSRIWEYPYVFHHLAQGLGDRRARGLPKVADIGSGVTFFPFSLARMGIEVICADIDPLCQSDFMKARDAVDYGPGQLDFRLIETMHLPFEDGECDAVYCISVLEHIEEFEQTVEEMHRILKPGGICVITCDLDLDEAGRKQLNTRQLQRLRSSIFERFRLVWPEETIHPTDLLTSRNSLYPNDGVSYWNFARQWAIQKVMKPILGRGSGHFEKAGIHPLAVLGLVLTKD